MAAEMKVTDAIAQLVLSHYLRDWDDCNESTRNALTGIMRAALEAGLAAMLDPVGYQWLGTANFRKRMQPGSNPSDWRTVYVIKEPK